MNTKAKIKIIKKGAVTESKPVDEIKVSKNSAREMMSTVTNWVSDFQTKRREETKTALEKLFPKPPTPSEV
jgi:hypothetical protein